MTALLPILHEYESTGTETGVSYYSEKCARRMQLNKEYGRTESSDEQKRGTAFGKLLELYYTGQLNTYALPVNDDNDDDPAQLALRMFREYRKYFLPDEFEILGAEEKFPSEDPQVGGLEAILLEKFFGVPISGRYDLTINIRPEHLPRIKEYRRVDLEPGRYLLDHKTKSKKDNLSIWRHAISPQFRVYPLAYNLLHPETPVLGVLANEVIPHAKMELFDKTGAPHSFRTFFVPTPNEVQTQAVKAWLVKKAAYLKTDEVNLDECVGATVCHHYKSGACFQI